MKLILLFVATLIRSASAAEPTSAEILAQSAASDWRAPDPQRTLYLELASGRVVIELQPEFAPKHVANIAQLVRQKYFDGLAILRAQDNYVVQWGDPNGEKPEARPLGKAKRSLSPEFFRPSFAEVPFTALIDPDSYAPHVGFSLGMPAARDEHRTWLVHCYGMVGVGRDEAADSGGGTELYVVIGHAPRHLDRNVTLVGRVISGIERLSTLPRGSGDLGFYTDKEARPPVLRVRLAADVPPNERTALELLRTDTPTFARFVDARRQRREKWFVDPVGHVDVCNVPLPVRKRSP
jgi:peptidylprolyl isomerase